MSCGLAILSTTISYFHLGYFCYQTTIAWYSIHKMYRAIYSLIIDMKPLPTTSLNYCMFRCVCLQNVHANQGRHFETQLVKHFTPRVDNDRTKTFYLQSNVFIVRTIQTLRKHALKMSGTTKVRLIHTSTLVVTEYTLRFTNVRDPKQKSLSLDAKKSLAFDLMNTTPEHRQPTPFASMYGNDKPCAKPMK